MKPTQRGKATQEHQTLQTTCKSSSGLLPALQGQAGNSLSTRNSQGAFSQSFSPAPSPPARVTQTKAEILLKRFYRHWLENLCELPLLPCPVWAFLGWIFLAEQPCPSTILLQVIQLTNKQGHAGFPCCREEEQGTQGREGQPTPCSGLQAAGTGTGSRACQGTTSHRQHCWTAGSNICTKPFKLGWIPPMPQEAFINRLSINPLIKYQH